MNILFYNPIVISYRDSSVPVLKADRRLSEDYTDHSRTTGTYALILEFYNI